MDQAVGVLRRGLQGRTPGFRLLLAQAQFQARLERRQRRAQLVGGIGDELRLPLEQAAQALGEVVQRLHQRPQFMLDLEHRQRPQVVRLALFHLAAQAIQRTQRGAHRQPHQHQRADAEDAQAQQGIGHQAARHALAGAFGLGHADLRHAAHARFADRLQQAHHAYVDALVDAVVELGQGRVVVGAQGIGGCRRKILVAGDHPSVDVVDLVEDPPGAVVGEGIQCHVGDVGAQGAVLLVEPVGDRPRRGQQGPVVGGVGHLATVPVGAQAARQEHQQQEQGQPQQQPSAQTAGISHPAPPAGSRGRGR